LCPWSSKFSWLKVFRVNVGRKNPGMFQVMVMMFMPELVVNGPTDHAFLVWRVVF